MNLRAIKDSENNTKTRKHKAWRIIREREKWIPRIQPCVSRTPREGHSTWQDESCLVCSAIIWIGSGKKKKNRIKNEIQTSKFERRKTKSQLKVDHCCVNEEQIRFQNKSWANQSDPFLGFFLLSHLSFFLLPKRPSALCCVRQIFFFFLSQRTKICFIWLRFNRFL